MTDEQLLRLIEWANDEALGALARLGSDGLQSMTQENQNRLIRALLVMYQSAGRALDELAVPADEAAI